MAAQFPVLTPHYCAPLFTGIAGPLTVINQPSVLTLSNNLKVTFEFVEVRMGPDGLKPEWTCGHVRPQATGRRFGRCLTHVAEIRVMN